MLTKLFRMKFNEIGSMLIVVFVLIVYFDADLMTNEYRLKSAY